MMRRSIVKTAFFFEIEGEMWVRVLWFQEIGEGSDFSDISFIRINPAVIFNHGGSDNG
jgi:hypothetical protein